MHQKVWHGRPGRPPKQATILTQDIATACVLPTCADLPLLVLTKHLSHSP